MHGFILQEPGSKNSTKLRLSYEQRVKPHHVWNWLTSHPRIIIPIVAALLAAFTVAVFDPIREWFVRVRVIDSRTAPVSTCRVTNFKLGPRATEV